MKRFKVLTLALICAFSAPTFAQESLIDIYNRALANDPAIREAEATYRALAETKPQTRALLLPSLNLSASRSNRYTDNASGSFDPILGGTVGSRSISDNDTHGYSLALSQTLFDWSLYAQLRQADKRVVRAETDFEAAKQQLLLR